MEFELTIKGDREQINSLLKSDEYLIALCAIDDIARTIVKYCDVSDEVHAKVQDIRSIIGGLNIG